ncbi:MarR family winged helix-turn-helix transcriptional regulator [Actinospica robiniae]|uniref:MarR family winged helix-turn-helix transcriptional regulator n=1 Tax=Actinospica robiniae TaxID=304901 RepID=UPI000423728D|nr:MarR family transcriptional regulator [Actinospica robiniae]
MDDHMKDARTDEPSGVRLATEAWEALFRAQVVLAREFAGEDVWGELTRQDYDVLYTLSKSSAGLRMTEINEQIMLTQPGVSRLIARLEQRGFVERRPDPDDARAQRIGLTAAGREVQQVVGRRHVRQIVRAMNRALEGDQLRQLHELCSALIAGAGAAKVEREGKATASAEDSLRGASLRRAEGADAEGGAAGVGRRGGSSGSAGSLSVPKAGLGRAPDSASNSAEPEVRAATEWQTKP